MELIAMPAGQLNSENVVVDVGVLVRWVDFF